MFNVEVAESGRKGANIDLNASRTRRAGWPYSGLLKPCGADR